MALKMDKIITLKIRQYELLLTDLEEVRAATNFEQQLLLEK